MIDFRYHLVSLAAVLIALSIGIVLGAGPLNDNIGSTLSGEVTKLRQEKEALR
ncbi:MAG TPA: copper transporter, partial [Janibacter terrae]|nr:copper transporter [Janibacter terrae]